MNAVDPNAPKRRRTAKERDLQITSYAQHESSLYVDNETTLAEILQPIFWVEVAGHLKAPSGKDPGSLINILSRDQLLEIQLRVVAIEQGLVYTRPRFPGSVFEHRDRIASMAPAAAEDPMPEVPEGYKVGSSPKANGGAGAYWVKLMMGAGKDISVGTFQNKRLAIEAAIKHAKNAGTYTDPTPPADPAPAEPVTETA